MVFQCSGTDTYHIHYCEIANLQIDVIHQPQNCFISCLKYIVMVAVTVTVI